MSQLEKLTLSLNVCHRTSCIDGDHLVNDIINKMSHLHTFNFNIVCEMVMISKELFPAPDDVKRPLIHRGYNVECYTDYSDFALGQCHIYSLPFTMERMDTFTNKFPGGLFMTVRQFVACGDRHPFNHDFFVRISQAFPLLNKLTIFNRNEQQEEVTHEQTLSIIKFPHLTTLRLSISSVDYAKQFLFDFKTCLPCLNTLYITYIDLMIVTDDFTNNSARANCSKLQHIIFKSPPDIYPENFYLYFPLLSSK